jgi:hypothetical protein
MNTVRFTVLSFATMAVFTVAAYLYHLPRQAPDLSRARSDFHHKHPGSSIEAVEARDLDEDLMSFRVDYRNFASNDKRKTYLYYQRVKSHGWKLDHESATPDEVDEPSP